MNSVLTAFPIYIIIYWFYTLTLYWFITSDNIICEKNVTTDAVQRNNNVDPPQRGQFPVGGLSSSICGQTCLSFTRHLSMPFVFRVLTFGIMQNWNVVSQASHVKYLVLTFNSISTMIFYYYDNKYIFRVLVLQ